MNNIDEGLCENIIINTYSSCVLCEKCKHGIVFPDSDWCGNCIIQKPYLYYIHRKLCEIRASVCCSCN